MWARLCDSQKTGASQPPPPSVGQSFVLHERLVHLMGVIAPPLQPPPSIGRSFVTHKRPVHLMGVFARLSYYTKDGCISWEDGCLPFATPPQHWPVFRITRKTGKKYMPFFCATQKTGASHGRVTASPLQPPPPVWAGLCDPQRPVHLVGVIAPPLQPPPPVWAGLCGPQRPVHLMGVIGCCCLLKAMERHSQAAQLTPY